MGLLQPIQRIFAIQGKAHSNILILGHTSRFFRLEKTAFSNGRKNILRMSLSCMDDDVPLNFCTECGANLHEYDRFCPACGHNISSNGPSPTHYGTKTSRLPAAVVMSFIWAVIGIISGACFLLFVDALTDLIINSPIWESVADLYGGEEWVRNSVIQSGSLLLISGVLAAVTGILCRAKRYFLIALIACIAGSVLMLTEIIGIIGFITAYLIYVSRNEFQK